MLGEDGRPGAAPNGVPDWPPLCTIRAAERWHLRGTCRRPSQDGPGEVLRLAASGAL